MSEPSQPNRRNGMSRRDFVRGKFWRVLGLKLSEVESTTQQTDAKPRRSIVMRYPRSLGEVATGDPAPENAILLMPTFQRPSPEERKPLT